MMKNLLTLLLFVTLFVSCSSDNESIPDTPILDPNSVEAVMKKLNIKPSNPELISLISFDRDTLNTKFVGGRKDNKAWFGRYKTTGEEIFSYSLSRQEGYDKYSHLTRASFLLVDKDKVILNSWITNSIDINYPDKPNYKSVLSVININTGSEISRLPISLEYNQYSLIQQQYFYLVQEKRDGTSCSRFHALSLDGKYLWSRDAITKDDVDNRSEAKEGINYYSHYNGKYYFVNAEELFFNSRNYNADPYLTADVYKFINFKTYELIFEIPIKNLPLRGENIDTKDIVYKIENVLNSNGNIRLLYSESKKTTIVNDPISGASTTEYKLLGMYFYDLDRNSGRIVGSGKL